MDDEELRRLSASGASLEFDDPSCTKLSEAIFGLVENFWAELSEKKAYETSKKESDKVFSLAIGSSPHQLDAILEVLTGGVMSTGVASASGRHFGNIPGGGIPSAVIADYLAAAMNKHAGISTASPGAVNVENAVLEWVASLLGFDRNKFGGCFTSGGSLATYIALAAARDAMGLKARDYQSNVVYAQCNTHFCFENGLRFLGLSECIFRRISVDDDYRIRTEELEKQMCQDIEEGLQPFFLLGTFGTTSSGAIDDLAQLSTLARRFGCWFHVDAAYGGFFALVDEIKEKMVGVENADSIILDPHKGLFLPFGTGILLVKNVNHLLRTHCFRPDYIDYEEDNIGPGSMTRVVSSEKIRGQRFWAAADVSPELTRDFRGLRVWLPLLYHGSDVFKDTLKEKLVLARHLHTRLKSVPDIEVGPWPQLTIVLFRFTLPSAEGADQNNENETISRENNVNKLVVSRVLENGFAYLTTIDASGFTWIRVAILSFRSHREEVDLAVKLIFEARKSLDADVESSDANDVASELKLPVVDDEEVGGGGSCHRTLTSVTPRVFLNDAEESSPLTQSSSSSSTLTRQKIEKAASADLLGETREKSQDARCRAKRPSDVEMNDRKM